MTPQEAITTLKREYLGDSEFMELAKQMGAKALEKQMPKKVEIHTDYDGTLWGENFVGKYIYCPCCNRHLISTINNNVVSGNKCKYCEHCGQALDWGDSE